MRERDRRKPLNEEFEAFWGPNRNGILHTTCTMPQKNVFNCKNEERVRDWKLASLYEFSKFGVINTRTFHTVNVTTKKYYQVSLNYMFLLHSAKSEEIIFFS